SRAPDPDLALSELVRLRESLDDDEGATRENGVAALDEALRTEETLRSRLLALLGSSSALGDHLVAGPTRWTRLREDLPSRADVIAASCPPSRRPRRRRSTARRPPPSPRTCGRSAPTVRG